MKYNAVIDCEFIATGTEPVTLTQVKDHLKITFNDDDAYLTELITECREAVQRFTGVALIDGTVTAIVNNGCGKQELPYGPVKDITSVIDKDGNTLDVAAYTLRGILFKYVDQPLCDFLQFEYTAGYTTVPADLIRALKEEIAYRYEHRGDDNGHIQGAEHSRNLISSRSQELSIPHKRMSWFL